MAPTTLRKALGAVKDQTSIGLAMVSSSLAPDLEVAIVKATSHDDEPAGERHVREILAFTSYSRAYVSMCVDRVSRRLSRTRDWVVALKSLVLVHRLLSDGDPAFQFEILHATRRGARLLNLSDFRDEAHTNSWDHSAFVRSYALYLDQRLECALHDSRISAAAAAGQRPAHERSASSDYEYRRSPPSFHATRSFHGERAPPAERTPVREMSSEDLLSRMSQLQKLLDRFLACRPTGRARGSRMILFAIYPVVRESFKIYADLCEQLAALLDRFFDLEYPDCAKAFESYASAAKQIDELVKFYAWCRETGVARSSEYPEVQQITDKLLDTLEEFMRERRRNPDKKPEPEPELSPEPAVAAEEISATAIKALPPPEGWEEEKQTPPAPAPQETADLVDLREDGASADDQGNRLALALFSAPANSWNAGDPEIKSAWHTPAAEPGKADWELMLVESASHLTNQKPTLAGGLDPVHLDGMYDQGLVRQHVSAQAPSGSASSVALPMRGSKQVLALPAPDGSVQTIGQDPFSASLSVPPPAYVQMADIEKKQNLLVQEQVLWQQYAREGMQGESSLAKLSAGYGYGYGLPPAIPYGMPAINGGGQYYRVPYAGP